MTDESLLASLLKGMQEQLTKQVQQSAAMNIMRIGD
jgi:hypothetical protein